MRDCPSFSGDRRRSFASTLSVNGTPHSWHLQMRSAGSEPNLGTSLIKIIRLLQVGLFEFLVFWPSVRRYGTTAPRQPIRLNACPNSRQNRQRAFSLDAKPFWVPHEYHDTAGEHQQTDYLEQH